MAPRRTIYAMTGGMGAGKTTFAIRLAVEKNAAFFSLDKTIRDFNQPIRSLEDYEAQMQKALEILSSSAVETLKTEKSVVFDWGGGVASRDWLKSIARRTGATIEVFHLEVPMEERRRRVQKRNLEKPNDVFFFHMSDEEFERLGNNAALPPEEDGIKVTRIK